MQSPDRHAMEQELEAIYRLYAALPRHMDSEFGLGGKLLWAGDLDLPGWQLLRAANIAGAASLAASADSTVQKQAVREGVVDFLVTTLGEALRILKNEIRKRQGVAVCVSLEPQVILREILDRGVLPDLLAASAAQSEEGRRFLSQGARCVSAEPSWEGRKFLMLEIPRAWARPIAEFDALLMGAIDEGDHANRRWLRLSPRYLGAEARRFRSLECDRATESRLIGLIGESSN